MANADNRIRDIIERFVEDLTTAVREAALESFATSFRVAPAGAPAGQAAIAPRLSAPTTETRAAAKKPRARRAGGSSKAVKRPRAKRNARGIKRDPALIEALTRRVAAHVKAHPGVGANAIAASLETSTREVELPLRRLLASKDIKRRGKKNLTKYFPTTKAAAASPR